MLQLKQLLGKKIDLAQNKEDAGKIISKLKDDVKVKNNLPVLAFLEHDFDNTSWNYGIEGFPEGNSPYDEFRVIDKNELIIACLIDEGGLMGNAYVKLLMTDKALYCCQKAEKQYLIENNRISYADLGKYVVNRVGESVELKTEEDTFPLLPTTLLGGNKENLRDAEELEKILLIIQEKILRSSDKAQSDRRSLYVALAKEPCKVILANGLDWRKINLTHRLMNDSVIGTECRIARLGMELYSCDFDNFCKLLDSYQDTDSEWCVEEFGRILKEYMEKISDSGFSLPDDVILEYNYEKEILIKPGECLIFNNTQAKILELVYKNQKIILAYLAVRNNPYVPMMAVSQYLSNRGIEENERKCILKFHARLQNQGMLEVYRCIKENGTFRKEWIPRIDSLGLTPLHYSLIMKNSRITDYIQKRQDKLADTSQDLNTEPGEYTSYIMLACLMEQYGYVKTVLNQTECVQSIVKEIKKTKMKMKAYGAAKIGVEIAGAMVGATLSNSTQLQDNEIYTQEDIEEYQEKAQMMLGETENYSAGISDSKDALAKSLERMQSEYQARLFGLMKPYMDAGEAMKASSEPLASLFFLLYMKPDVLEQVLSADMEKCYYFSDGNSYALLVDAGIFSEEGHRKYESVECF